MGQGVVVKLGTHSNDAIDVLGPGSRRDVYCLVVVRVKKKRSSMLMFMRSNKKAVLVAVPRLGILMAVAEYDLSVADDGVGVVGWERDHTRLTKSTS